MIASILIIVFSHGNSGVFTHVSMQEFSSMTACVEASKQIAKAKDNGSVMRDLKMVCVPK